MNDAELREKVVYLHDRGRTRKQIASLLSIPVWRIVAVLLVVKADKERARLRSMFPGPL